MNITKLENAVINSLVIKYREGDTEAAEALLKAFAPLIGKYLNLFFKGEFNRNDKDIMDFLRTCSTKDPTVIAEIIKKRLTKYDAEELISVAKLALLDTAKNHENISGYYKYIIRKFIANMIWDEFEQIESRAQYKVRPQFLYYTKKKDVVIDDAWVIGVTCGRGFNSLSKNQREIVKLCYNDNVPDIHVCMKLNISSNDLKKEKEEIKRILSKELNIKV